MLVPGGYCAAPTAKACVAPVTWPDGGLGELANISDSHNIYYDANDPANAYLNDKIYSLNGGGFLLPASGLGVVPEPGTTALVMLGGLAVAIYAWRRSRA